MGVLHICTPNYFKDKHKSRYLCRTADRLEMKVHHFGIGKEWTNFFDCKIVGLRKHLEEVEDDIVLCLDASDSVLLQGPEFLLEAYDKARKGCDLLIQSDRHCFPDVSVRPFFDSRSGFSQGYIYPCSGAIMGRRDKMIDALDIMIDKHENLPVYSPGYNDDQGWWSTGISQGWFDMEIDYDSLVSLCAYRSKLFWFELPNGEFGRDGKSTGILHFAGMRGRRNAFTHFVSLRQLGP